VNEPVDVAGRLGGAGERNTTWRSIVMVAPTFLLLLEAKMTVPMDVDRVRVIDEVHTAFLRYETALNNGDIVVMAELFWTSPEVTRFGAADYQVGAEELARFRARRGALPAPRFLEDTRIVPFGNDAAVVTTLFRSPGNDMVGRQSQTWIRIDDAWQIVHAHVSQIPTS
jgi:hypothetical protein